MNIVRLAIKNFLSVSEVDLRPGKVNQVIGNNNAGKTTILKALEVALKGNVDGSMVKHGTDGAELILEFDNEMTVRRRIRPDGKHTVDVRKGGFKADSPQTFLNTLVDGLAFNPLELLEPKRRTEVLLRAVDVKLSLEKLQEAVGACPVPLPPLNFEDHGLKVAEAARSYFYARRTEANKVAAGYEKELEVREAETPPLPEGVREVPESEILDGITKARAGLDEEKTKVLLLSEREKTVRQTQEAFERKKLEIDNLRTRAEAIKAEMKALEEQGREQGNALMSVRPDQVKIDTLTAKIKTLQDVQLAQAKLQGVREKHKGLKDLRERFNQAQKFAESLDGAVRALGPAFQAKLVAEADLPVKGLSYHEGQFYLDGASIDNLSSSKALILAVQVCRKLASQTKLICIDGAELLDQRNYDVLRDSIEGDGFTYFISKVGDVFEGHNDAIVEMHGGECRGMSPASA